MSVTVMGEVWKLGLHPNEKFILLAFADHADDDGLTYPSIGRVAWKTGYAKRQVQVIVAALRSRGLLETVARDRGGRHLATVYRICPEKGVKTAPFLPIKRVQSRAEKGALGLSKRVHPSAYESSVTVFNREKQNPLKTKTLPNIEVQPEDIPDWQRARVPA